jgi:hypothetical protein
MKSSDLKIYLLLYNTLISLSSIFVYAAIPGILIIGINYILLGMIYATEGFSVNRKILIIIIAYSTIVLVKSLYVNDIRVIPASFHFISALLFFSFIDYRTIRQFNKYASNWTLVNLIAALVGFILAYIGFSPIAEFQNLDGRTSYLYYTTFTNTEINSYNKFIRPAGFYDEPGTLAFLSSIVIFLRLYMRESLFLTFVLIIMTFITFSLAYTIFLVLILIWYLSFYKVRTSYKVLTVSVMVLFSTVFIGQEEISKTILNRFTLDESAERGLTGGQRFTGMFLVLSNYAEFDSSILFGIDPICSYSVTECTNKYGYMGENVLAPFGFHGLLMSLPYYLFIIGLLFLSLYYRTNKFILVLAVLLIFVQRPYVLQYGYTTLAAIITWTLIKIK